MTLKLQDLHKSYCKSNDKYKRTGKALSTEKKKIMSNLAARKVENQTNILLTKPKKIQLFKNTLKFRKIEPSWKKKVNNQNLKRKNEDEDILGVVQK